MHPGVLSGNIAWRHGAPLPASRPQTLEALLDAARARAGTAVVLRDGDRQATWDDLLRWSGRLAQAWSAQVAPGARIAILLPNGLPHLLAELAAWRLAAVAVPLFTGQGVTRIARLLKRFTPALVVATPELAASAPHGTPTITPQALLAEAERGTELPWRQATAATPCLIQCTSGSTGEPRGVVLSHDNLCSQQAAFADLWPEVGPGDRLAGYLPWHHSFGGLAERLWALCRGARFTVVPGGGRDHERLVATVRAENPTVLMSVPKMHRVLTAAEAIDRRHLRWAFTAGAALGADEEAWYGARGIPLYEGWGLTECSPSATITPPGVPRIPGVVGQPIPGVAVGVAPDGRLLVAGPGIMLGYFDDGAASVRVLRIDPHFGRVLDTGDLGAWTAHGLRLGGRADETRKLANGEKVALAELARRLEARPGVRHALVLIDGEKLTALLSPAANATPAALADAVATVNAAESVPYRRIAAAYRLAERASCESGLLTPSHKVARGAWTARFAGWRAAGGAAFATLDLSALLVAG